MSDPSLQDIFVAMSAASVGDASARVAIPMEPRLDEPATQLAMALNLLLDDLAFRAAAGQRDLAERGRIADRMRILSEASREFSTATYDYGHLVDVVARRLGEIFGDMCAIRILTEDGEWLESTGAVYHPDPELRAAAREVLSGRQRFGEGVAGRVAATRQPLLSPSISTAEFLASSEERYRPVLERLGITSSITVPLLYRGNVVGVVNLLRSRPDDPYDQDDLQFVQSLADHAAVAIGNSLSYAAERAARDAAEQATTALHQAESRFARLSDSGIIGIILSDVQGNILEANDSYLKMVGYSREELLQGQVRWADLTPPEFVPLAARAVEQLRTSGVAPPWETESFRKDGSRIPTLVGVAMLEYPQCIAFVADLTDRKQAEAGRMRAEESLRQSEEQLRQAQKMEAVGRLAGGVAHDFNNVLSVILSYGDMILADLKPADPLRADMEEIKKAASRAAGLTRQLLMFSRQQVFDPKVMDLQEVLTGMSNMLQRIVGEDVELVTVAPKSSGRVKVDPSHIEQVILNLIVNARDAMPRGGKITIETANIVLDEEYAQSHLPAKAGPYVMVAVTDTGTGMSRETQRRIFEPFFTTKDIGKGTGLGLSTVFGLVRQSGGYIWVYSELGVGTTFKIYLPSVDAEVDVLRAQVAPATLRGTETVLLVEDEEQVRTIVLNILRRQGYRVLVAQHAGEALLLCERHPEAIDLLLTDVVMPQMSGPDLAKRLASTRPEMKVLCMSGYTDDSIVRYGVLETGMAFLQKPITPASLSRKLREVLDAPVAGGPQGRSANDSRGPVRRAG